MQPTISHDDEDAETVQCTNCGEEYPKARRLLGFTLCTNCGEAAAREVTHCVVPMHKSNLVVVAPSERHLLAGISNKGGQVTGGGSSNAEAERLHGSVQNADSDRKGREDPRGERDKVLVAGGSSHPNITKALKDLEARDSVVQEAKEDRGYPRSRQYVVESSESPNRQQPRRRSWFRRSGYKRGE